MSADPASPSATTGTTVFRLPRIRTEGLPLVPIAILLVLAFLAVFAESS